MGSGYAREQTLGGREDCPSCAIAGACPPAPAVRRFFLEQWHPGRSSRQSCGIFDPDQFLECPAYEDGYDHSRRFEPTWDEGTGGSAGVSRDGGPAAE